MDMNTTMPMVEEMQMTLYQGYTIEYLLFQGWTVTTGGQFTAALLFAALLGVLSELAGYLLMKGAGKLNFLVYLFLKTINYSQMLVVMSYNIWIIVTLVVAQTFANFFFRKLAAKYSLQYTPQSHH